MQGAVQSGNLALAIWQSGVGGLGQLCGDRTGCWLGCCSTLQVPRQWMLLATMAHSIRCGTPQLAAQPTFKLAIWQSGNLAIWQFRRIAANGQLKTMEWVHSMYVAGTHANQQMACDAPGCHRTSLPHVQSGNLAKWPEKRWEGCHPTSRSYALQSPRITGGSPHV